MVFFYTSVSWRLHANMARLSWGRGEWNATRSGSGSRLCSKRSGGGGGPLYTSLTRQETKLYNQKKKRTDLLNCFRMINDKIYIQCKPEVCIIRLWLFRKLHGVLSHNRKTINNRMMSWRCVAASTPDVTPSILLPNNNQINITLDWIYLSDPHSSECTETGRIPGVPTSHFRGHSNAA